MTDKGLDSSQQEQQISEKERLIQLNDIQNASIQEDVEKEPLISSVFPISVLLDEYQNASTFLKKASALESVFKKASFRKARKDGNCFYRSFLFRLCELLSMGKHFFERFGIFEKVKQFSEMMVKAGFDKMVFEDFESFFLEFLEAIRAGSINILNVQQSLSDKSTFNYYVMYLRFAISAYIRTSGGQFDGFFDSDYELKQFCMRDVERIDAEADQIQIISLFNLFGIPIRIFYLDNSSGNIPNVFSLPEMDNNTPDEVNKSQGDYLVQLLYRPGHYDILY